jgi:hypothetical protein
MTKREKITLKAKEILAANPSGVRFSELVRSLQEAFPGEAYGNFTGAIWNLDSRFPSEIYKPSRGLFRLTQFKSDEPAAITVEPVETVQVAGKIREADFYEAFANYLVQDLEECTKAIPLGGSMFGAKWGTPDIFGIFKARESDIFKASLEVVVAEVKTDCSQPITAFGQACAYRLFAHKSYLVVPRDSQKEDIDRLDALCVISGIGLILFDTTNVQFPDFEIRVRAAKHEPDAFYINSYLKRIADTLEL